MKSFACQLRAPVVVFGAGKSGVAAARLLAARGADVILADEGAGVSDVPGLAAGTKGSVRAAYGASAAAALESAATIVLSPGIPRTQPAMAAALRRGARVIGELELGWRERRPADTVVAVTGSNGKTTTTAWLAHILQAAGHRAVACGNIGLAVCEAILHPARGARILAIECSSFQLESVEEFRPRVALLTNLSPNHLDRYPSLRAYYGAKKAVYRNQTARDALIVNAANRPSTEWARGARARLYQCDSGGRRLIERGASCRRGVIRLTGVGRRGERAILPAGELPLPGRHNLENALAAMLAAALLGASDDQLRKGLVTFSGIEHRIEYCGTKAGIRFYNDSKATTVEALATALRSFDGGVVLIAGGRDKKSDYSRVADLVAQRVKHLVAIGEAAPLLERAWGAKVPGISRADSMKAAVRDAFARAGEGGVVLLSPACASYDWYNNFEERGRDFKAAVTAL